MIQDIEPHVYNNEFKVQMPDKESYALYYNDRRCLVKYDGEKFEFPKFKDIEKIDKNIYKEAVYVFSIDNKEFYLVDDKRLVDVDGFTLEDVFIFRTAHPHYLSFAGVTGYQLNNWYNDNVFCGRCGKRLVKDTKERMMRCTCCGNMIFPKLSPAVIIAVTDNNRLLLSKYAGGPYKKYALLAGYTEVGETVEETVAREVFEETGLKVKNIRYYKSQPWSFSSSVLMGFYCDLDGDDVINLQEDELSFAGWFERENIPVEPKNDSLTNEMIIAFKNNKEV